ncbi:hypothetical protein BGX26_008438 [Mortierella sp. AD094]|nr:hypothetical protein BGX26_008438 [Mortierella sp. AD094]
MCELCDTPGIYGSIEGEESEDQSRDYHRNLYAQLAKLTRLQELGVGFLLCYERRCKTSPRFSLESGLGILEGFKELRSLTVHYKVNDTQRQELKWMCEHWPKLTMIDGINLEMAESWWNPKGDQIGGNDTSMPKRIRDKLTARDTTFNDHSTYNYGSEEFY